MAAALLKASLLLLCVAASSTQKPNIVLVVLDDVGWSDLSYNSDQSSFSTPRIDELANRGIKFQNYYVHPTCTPTRAALMTGLYSANTGLTIAAMPGSTVGLPLHLSTMPQLLRKRGYQSHMVGKWHLGHAQWAQTPVGRGFQSFTGSLLSQFDSYNKQMVKPDGSAIAVDWILTFENRSFVHFLDQRHATVAITEGAEQVIKSHALQTEEQDESNVFVKKRSPLFLYVAYTAAHAPLQPMPEHASQCLDVKHPWRRGMCGMVKGLDDGVSNISQYIEKYLGPNSVLVVTSDNGAAPWFGGLNAPLRGGKTSPFEGGVRVPAFAVDFTAKLDMTFSSTITTELIPHDRSTGSYLGQVGRCHRGLLHVADWLPTFLSWAKGNQTVHDDDDDDDDGIDQLLLEIDGYDMSGAFLCLSEGGCVSEDMYTPRSDVLLDMYYPGEAIWQGEQVVAIRSGKWKLVQGNARDPHWYSEHTYKLNSSNHSWPILVGELVIRLLEPLMGISQFDTLRAVIIWSWVHSCFLSYDTYLFDLELDPSETNNLASQNPEIVSNLLEKTNQIKHKRPIQYEYWMVVPNFQQTLVKGLCTDEVANGLDISHHHSLLQSSTCSNEEGGGDSSGDIDQVNDNDCWFAHPFIDDNIDPTDMDLLHTKDVAKRLIKEMIFSLFKYMVAGSLLSFLVVKILFSKSSAA